MHIYFYNIFHRQNLLKNMQTFPQEPGTALYLISLPYDGFAQKMKKFMSADGRILYLTAIESGEFVDGELGLLKMAYEFSNGQHPQLMTGGVRATDPIYRTALSALGIQQEKIPEHMIYGEEEEHGI